MKVYLPPQTHFEDDEIVVLSSGGGLNGRGRFLNICTDTHRVMHVVCGSTRAHTHVEGDKGAGG